MTDRINFRLGDLQEPLQRHLKKTKQTPSDYIRGLIAIDLDRTSPVMRPGRANSVKISGRKEKR